MTDWQKYAVEHPITTWIVLPATNGKTHVLEALFLRTGTTAPDHQA